MALISLVYVSFAKGKMSGDDLETLLEQCRTNNEPLGVTGMLLYRDGYFIQALEGEESVVMPLFNKIALDQRHQHIIVAYKGEISKRTFKDWSMGFKNISEVDFSKYPEYRDYRDFSHEYFANNPTRAMSLLSSFYQEVNF